MPVLPLLPPPLPLLRLLHLDSCRKFSRHWALPLPVIVTVVGGAGAVADSIAAEGVPQGEERPGESWERRVIGGKQLRLTLLLGADFVQSEYFAGVAFLGDL